MHIYTEITPNPATLKFVVDRTLLQNGVADFPDAASAEGNSEFASFIFNYPFVGGVFLGRNFVTVTKSETARWEEVIPVIKDELRKFVEEGRKFIANEEVVIEASHDEADEIINRIRILIEEQVRPAVAMDGGDIVYESFDDGVVKLRLRGSCSGCPSSMVTLKMGIENMLKRMVPEVKSVEAV
jgi:NFU1 iron-sulfur cluster scaffold homolog, mitochondrial